MLSPLEIKQTLEYIMQKYNLKNGFEAQKKYNEFKMERKELRTKLDNFQK